MSIRLRLTLLYCLILALILVGHDITLYYKVADDGLALVDDVLRSEELRIIESSWFKLGQIDYATKKMAAAEIYVQTLGLDGSVLDRTKNLGDLAIPVTPATYRNVSNGGSKIETVAVGSGQLRVYSKRVKDVYGATPAHRSKRTAAPSSSPRFTAA